MTVQTFTTPDLPREFMSTNPFVSDERCEVFQIVVGDTREEVILEVQRLHGFNISDGEFAETHLFDYDFVNDNVSEKWVGFTCKDKESFLDND